MKKGTNLKCLKCGRVVGSSPGISQHMKKHHKEGALFHKNWAWTTEKCSSVRYRKTNKKQKYSQKPKKASQNKTEIQFVKCSLEFCIPIDKFLSMSMPYITSGGVEESR